MNKEMKDWINSNHKLSSMFASVCGSIKVMLGERCGDATIAKGQDMQDVVESAVLNILASVRPDTTSWPYVKNEMTYDDYLVMREHKGKQTAFDLVRPGLFERNFSNSFKWFDHLARINENRKSLESMAGTGEKQCKKCGFVKTADKFKTGAVCNACRNKAYRANKAQRNLDAGIDEHARLVQRAQNRTNKAWEDATPISQKEGNES